MSASRRVMMATLMLAMLGSLAQPVSAAADFPAGYEGYNTYAEVDARLDALVAAYGPGTPTNIVRRSVIGQSYEGRDIWAVKVSDRPGADEGEPEVLSECGMHAREHITVEMCLYMLRLLTDNYGQPTALGERVTSIVNSREIWIIPSLNPDGAEFNISGGTFHGWRKNRQPNPGSTAIGIDLNRNWSYMWNCCGGSSGKPGSARYRGKYPFEAVEDAVLRDFILSRRVGGIQQIRTTFNWHSYGEFILRPYGYTREDVPPTMTQDDYQAFVAMGGAMARLNGYRSRQGSDSYIYDGDFPAWAYGDQRIFVYTFEMYPPWGCKGCGGFRPPDEVIERETTRNRDAVLYFLEQADCPHRSAGLGATRCGPFDDDFETGRGWDFGGDGDGSGFWERGIPGATSTAAGAKQLASVPSGQAALVTGRAAGASAEANDVDGLTWARSRPFKLGSGSWTLAFRYTFANDAAATADDWLRVSVVAGATRTTVWSVDGQSANANAVWTPVTLDLSAFALQTVRLLVEAGDGASDNLVEAAIDDMRVYRTP